MNFVYCHVIVALLWYSSELITNISLHQSLPTQPFWISLSWQDGIIRGCRRSLKHATYRGVFWKHDLKRSKIPPKPSIEETLIHSFAEIDLLERTLEFPLQNLILFTWFSIHNLPTPILPHHPDIHSRVTITCQYTKFNY